MAYEQREGDISIFRNDKRTSDNQPSMRGTALIGGVKFKVSLWEKGSGDRSFLAGKIEIDNYHPNYVGGANDNKPAPPKSQAQPEPDNLNPEQTDLPF